jgi:sugar phosphate isomerase/epimerase
MEIDPSMRIGVAASTLSAPDLSPTALLEKAHERGLAGIQLGDATTIDADLDTDALEAFRRRAEHLGLFLSVTLPPLNRWSDDSSPSHQDSGALARRLYRHLEAAATLGCSHVRAYMGRIQDRAGRRAPWSTQREEVIDLLRRLAPAAREMKLRIGLENHRDQTASELLQMVEAVGPDVAGILLNTGNLPLSLDPPVEAAALLKRHILAVRVSDIVLRFTTDGILWQSRPVGAGILPILDILALLAGGSPDFDLVIEINPRVAHIPIFSPSFLDEFEGLRPRQLAEIVKLTSGCEQRFRDGTLADFEETAKVSWADRREAWLAQSVGYLRPVAELFGGL